MKALGIGGLALHEVEVGGGRAAAPRLGRRWSAARRGVELEVSLTHRASSPPLAVARTRAA